jgi:hypothetical protein
MRFIGASTVVDTGSTMEHVEGISTSPRNGPAGSADTLYISPFRKDQHGSDLAYAAVFVRPEGVSDGLGLDIVTSVLKDAEAATWKWLISYSCDLTYQVSTSDDLCPVLVSIRRN